jgi:DNA-binding beta-propeller fold protein YncE
MIYSRAVIFRLFPLLLLLLLQQPELLSAQALSFGLKSAPPDMVVHLDGVVQRPVSTAAGIRNYSVPNGGTLRFSAAGYKGYQYESGDLPVKDGLVQVKLEKDTGIVKLIGEYSTGVQPKSAYWTPDGRRVFVPLLGQHGVDVFRLENHALVYEKRLSVPDSNRPGFVEVMIDERRGEFWVSNMEEGKVHIYDLDKLEYKLSVKTGGSYPKVIAQNPAGDITVVSNWVSRNISLIDSETKELIRLIPVGGTPRGMAFSPDGGLLYVAIYDEAIVAVVDMKEYKLSKRFRLYEGEGAVRHVIYHDNKLYVSDMHRGTVNILNATTGALLVSRRIGSNINTIVLSPDGKRVFASSRGRNNPIDYTIPGPEFGAVYIIKADDLTLEERIWGRNQPTGLGVSPDGKYLVFTDFLDANLELYFIKAPGINNKKTKLPPRL